MEAPAPVKLFDGWTLRTKIQMSRGWPGGSWRKEAYAYYLRCIEYITAFTGHFDDDIPNADYKPEILSEKEIFDNPTNNRIIYRVIKLAHRLHESDLVNSAPNHDYPFNECGMDNCPPWFNWSCGDSRCECGNRRVKITQEGLNIDWITATSLDSKIPISRAIAY